MVLLGIFGVFLVGGVLYFAGFAGDATEGSVGEVLIWGTLDAQGFNTIIAQLAEENPDLTQVRYEQKDERTYRTELTEALASGTGPDAFVLRQDQIVSLRGIIRPIPYETFPRRQFEESFVQGTDLFLVSEGVLGIPIAVDPLVLYWNQDLLASAGFAQPPQYWDELFDIAERVSVRDDANNVTRSAIAFGEYENVNHAKAILSTLIMQAGGEVVTRDETGRIRASLASQVIGEQQSAQSALRFFTEFANPTKTVYSWNRSLPDARDAFAAGDVALYVGFASELALIQAQNPNLNFAVAPVPQIRGNGREVTFGNMYAFAIPTAAPNPSGGLITSYTLSGTEVSAMLSQARGTPSPRRDVLAPEAEFDGADSVFRDMALVADAWFDPDPAATNEIFRGMIEDVTTGARRLSESVQQADKEINEILGL